MSWMPATPLPPCSCPRPSGVWSCSARPRTTAAASPERTRATPAPTSASTGTTRAPSAQAGTEVSSGGSRNTTVTAPRFSRCSSPPSTAAPVRSRRRAPGTRPAAGAGASPSPANGARPSKPSARPRRRTSGRTVTRSGPGAKARSPRPPVSPVCAAHPLPQPADDPPRPRLRRHRDQPHSHRPMADRHPTRRHPDLPPRSPHARGLTTRITHSSAESFRAEGKRTPAGQGNELGFAARADRGALTSRFCPYL